MFCDRGEGEEGEEEGGEEEKAALGWARWTLGLKSSWKLDIEEFISVGG